MISRVSLFNKGIYKSTVRRNLWGAALYFILLFLMTSMPLISDIDSEYIMNRIRNGYSVPIIYQDQYLQMPILIAIAVPTVVAMLLYRFVHSKRTAVFIHSIPVGRTANYVSTLAAAFTLMAAPVILNGMVLAGLSLTAYSRLFTVQHCLVWIGLNLLCQFVMFSVSTLAAMITGNTIATAGLNVLLHTFAMIVVGCFTFVADNFLYGYVSDSQLFSAVLNSNPAVWISSIASHIGHSNYSSMMVLESELMQIPWYICGAVVLYAVSWFLYKKRGLEAAEDIAAFKVLNPIYKYFVTFIGTMAVYAIFNTFFYENKAVFFTVVLLLSVVIYFACEMLLKKTFKVWRSYKGYVCFGGAFAVMICIFAFTSFFGYETRVPDVDDIEKVAVYNYYYRENEPYVGNSEIIQYAVDKHSELITHQNIIEYNNGLGHYDTRVHFKYQLKNGKTLTRAYTVKQGTNYTIMNGLYSNDEYVTANEGIFRDDKLLRVVFNGLPDMTINDLDKAQEFVDCVRKDVLALDYNQMHISYNTWGFGFEVLYEMTRELEDGPTSSVASIGAYDGLILPEASYIDGEYHNLNANYTNTINWLKNNGYGQVLKLDINSPVYIVDYSEITDEQKQGKGIYEYMEMGKELAMIENDSDRKTVAQFITEMPVKYEVGKKYDYVIYHETYDEYDKSPVIITQTDKESIEKLLSVLAAE